jgi:hypothetical protein
MSMPAQDVSYDPDFAPAAAAAVTTRLFELGWIERGSLGQRRRSVRVTPAGTEGLARTFGLDLVGSCRSCEKS